jgi:Uma2 family endonuclease
MHADPAVRREELVRRWGELIVDQHSPDRCELNEFGEMILSPAPTTIHQRIAKAVASELERQLGPEAIGEVAVLTDRGIRVPDVAWMKPERWDEWQFESPLPFAPDLCVEVVSPGNAREEIAMKVGAYLRAGAREVIVVGLSGEVEFFGNEGKRERSALGLSFNLPANLFENRRALP